MAAQTDPRQVETTVTQPNESVNAPLSGLNTTSTPVNGRAADAQRTMFLRQWRKDHPYGRA